MTEVIVQPDIVLYALRYGLGQLIWAHDEVCRAVVENASELPTGIRQAAERELASWIECAWSNAPRGVYGDEYGRMLGQAEAALDAIRNAELVQPPAQSVTGCCTAI